MVDNPFIRVGSLLSNVPGLEEDLAIKVTNTQQAAWRAAAGNDISSHTVVKPNKDCWQVIADSPVWGDAVGPLLPAIGDCVGAVEAPKGAFVGADDAGTGESVGAAVAGTGDFVGLTLTPVWGETVGPLLAAIGDFVGTVDAPTIQCAR